MVGRTLCAGCIHPAYFKKTLHVTTTPDLHPRSFGWFFFLGGVFSWLILPSIILKNHGPPNSPVRIGVRIPRERYVCAPSACLCAGVWRDRDRDSERAARRDRDSEASGEANEETAVNIRKRSTLVYLHRYTDLAS